MTDPMQTERKLWLWKNFVNGKPEYWAFDNPFPINLDNGDPQTLGEPCGYALLKPSRQGRTDVSEETILRAIGNSTAASELRSLRDALSLAKSRIAELEGGDAWVLRLRRTAAHLRENSLSLAKYPDMGKEARARELAALYIKEIADMYAARAALKEDSE